MRSVVPPGSVVSSFPIDPDYARPAVGAKLNAPRAPAAAHADGSDREVVDQEPALGERLPGQLRIEPDGGAQRPRDVEDGEHGRPEGGTLGGPTLAPGLAPLPGGLHARRQPHAPSQEYRRSARSPSSVRSPADSIPSRSSTRAEAAFSGVVIASTRVTPSRWRASASTALPASTA